MFENLKNWTSFPLTDKPSGKCTEQRPSWACFAPWAQLSANLL